MFFEEFNFSFKTHLSIKTIVMGASFRKVDQILALAGCDRLTISPNLLAEMQQSNAPVERKLNPNQTVVERPALMTEAEFRWQHNSDAMAVEKLAEGIRAFAVDQGKLEDMIGALL